MHDVLIEGEPLELIGAAFRGMRARRGHDGWISVSGRLDRVPGEALLRALRRAEAALPRRIGSTREEHRAAALDEIARQYAAAAGIVLGEEPAVPIRPHRERVRSTADVACERFRRPVPGSRHLVAVPRPGEPRP